MKKFVPLLLFLLLAISGCRSSILDDPSTSISFSLAEDSHVKLTIENSYHTTVSVVLDAFMVAGYQSVSTDASHFLEGIYFYTLEIRGSHSNYYLKITKQMLLFK